MSDLSVGTVNATVRDLADVAVRQPARDLTPIELRQSWIESLARDLFETLFQTPGGIGLAATQVGILLRIAVIALRDGSQPLVMLSPSYEPATSDLEAEDERCLSVPGFVASVPRYKQIRVSFLDLGGDEQTGLQEGFLARVMQHEIDHLDGILCIDRAEDKEAIRAESEGYPARQAARALHDLEREKDE
jgi:peptide deformylase